MLSKYGILIFILALSKSSSAREKQETPTRPTNMNRCKQTVVNERDFLTTEMYIDRHRKHIILNVIRDKICGGKIRATVSHNRVPYTVLHVSNILQDTRKYNVIWKRGSRMWRYYYFWWIHTCYHMVCRNAGYPLQQLRTLFLQ